MLLAKYALNIDLPDVSQGPSFSDETYPWISCKTAAERAWYAIYIIKQHNSVGDIGLFVNK